MPSLPKQRIIVHTKDGQFYDARVTAGVTTVGIFTLGIPDDLVKIAKIFATHLKDNPDKVKVDTPFRQPARLHSSTMAHGITFLKACATEFMKAEETVERVIVYRVTAQTAVWIAKDGTLCPYGHFDDDSDGAWWKPKSKVVQSLLEHDHVTYMFGFFAVVKDR